MIEARKKSSPTQLSFLKSIFLIIFLSLTVYACQYSSKISYKNAIQIDNSFITDTQYAIIKSSELGHQLHWGNIDGSGERVLQIETTLNDPFIVDSNHILVIESSSVYDKEFNRKLQFKILQIELIGENISCSELIVSDNVIRYPSIFKVNGGDMIVFLTGKYISESPGSKFSEGYFATLMNEEIHVYKDTLQRSNFGPFIQISENMAVTKALRSSPFEQESVNKYSILKFNQAGVMPEANLSEIQIEIPEEMESLHLAWVFSLAYNKLSKNVILHSSLISGDARLIAGNVLKGGSFLIKLDPLIDTEKQRVLNIKNFQELGTTSNIYTSSNKFGNSMLSILSVDKESRDSGADFKISRYDENGSIIFIKYYKASRKIDSHLTECKKTVLRL